MYKLIASDLDGTLLRSDKTVSEETIDTLIKLDKQGVIFLPSTGRTFRELPEEIANLPFLHYALTVNGGAIYDYHNKCNIFEVSMDNQLIQKVLAFCKNLPVHPSVIIDGKRMMPGNEKGEIDPYIMQKAPCGIIKNACGYFDLIQAVKETDSNVHKMLIYANSTEEKAQAINALQKQFPQLEITSSGPLFIEVNSKGVNKGKALHYLCKHLNIATKDTIAFGDAENDIPLLDAAGFAVVMANGTEETKKHADEIAECCDDDGLRKTIEKLFDL